MSLSGDDSRLRNYDLYEFGVFLGVGIGEKLQTIRQILGDDAGPRHVWGFDSFEGLPRDDENPADHFLDVHTSFSSWAAQEQRILQNINFSRTTLVKGFYNESLTQELLSRYEMKPAWWVNIDCDIYSSTLQALDWLFKNKLIRSGTRVYYDDVLIYALGTAEMKAHDEITKRYNVVWKKLLAHTHFFELNHTVPYLFEVVSYNTRS